MLLYLLLVLLLLSVLSSLLNALIIIILYQPIASTGINPKSATIQENNLTTWDFIMFVLINGHQSYICYQ